MHKSVRWVCIPCLFICVFNFLFLWYKPGHDILVYLTSEGRIDGRDLVALIYIITNSLCTITIKHKIIYYRHPR